MTVNELREQGFLDVPVPAPSLSVPTLRHLTQPIVDLVDEQKALDSAQLSFLRSVALLSSERDSSTQASASTPSGTPPDDTSRVLDTEIIAIYW